MKKFLILFFSFLVISPNTVFAGFREHYNAAQMYMDQFQYSSAISEYKKALRINYLDNSTRIGLLNAYISRGTYFANKEQNYSKAANDFRSALFYLKYYTDEKNIQNSSEVISSTLNNLEQCLNYLHENRTATARYEKGKALRGAGEFAAAAYEFNQSAQTSNKNLSKNSHIQTADIMKILNNDTKAIEYYKKAIALDNTDADLRLKYARTLDKIGDYEAATKEYNFALAQSEDNKEILYALEKIYLKKLEENPNNAEINSSLGAIMQKQNKLNEAYQYYLKAESIQPSNLTTRLNLGTLYQQKKEYSKAIDAYNSILVLHPNHLEANYYKAEALYKSGNTPEAMEIFKKILAIDPKHAGAKKHMFEVLESTMSPEQILAYMNENGIKTDKQSIDAMYEHAVSLHKQKKTKDAIRYYNEVLKLKSEPEVYVNLALAHSDQDEFDKALDILNDAKAKFPNNTQISKTMTEIRTEIMNKKYENAAKYFNNSDYKKALEEYNLIQPQTKEVLMAIAACYKGLEDNTKAIEYYEKVLNLEPTNSDIAYYIGVLYAEKENWTSAKIYLQKALSLNANNQKAKDLLTSVIEQNNLILINKAIEAYDSNQFESALKIISQILTEDPKNAYAHYYRGLIYDSKKLYTQAIEEYKKAALNNKDLVITNYLIALDYDTLCQYKNAYIYYKKFLSLTQNNDEYKTYATKRCADLKVYEQ